MFDFKLKMMGISWKITNLEFLYQWYFFFIIW